MTPRPDLYVFRVTNIHDPSAPVQFAGRNPTIGVSLPQRSPVGLSGWRTENDARRDLSAWLNLSTVVGAVPWRYELVRMGPRR